MKSSTILFIGLCSSLLISCDPNNSHSDSETKREQEWKRRRAEDRARYLNESDDAEMAGLKGGDADAQFPGGQTAMSEWLQTHMVYPEHELDNGIGGRVYLRFVVAADGTISNVKVSKGVCPALDAEALRAVRAMPRWIPGRVDGKPVNQWYNLPIRFNPG